MRFEVNDAALTDKELGGFCVGWKEPLDGVTLCRALRGSDCYVTARDEHGKLVGFVNAISDGVFAAYIPLLEVLPEHQGRGVGTELMRHLLAHLSGLRIVDLMCDVELEGFYGRLGMYRMLGMRFTHR